MDRVNMKLTIIGLLISAAGLYFAIFPVSKSQSSTANLTVVQPQQSVVIHQLTPQMRQSQASIKQQKTLPSSNIGLSRVQLTVSAMNSDIEIRESKNGIPYSGGSISSMGTSHIIFIPKGQILNINMSGMGNNIDISNSIADQIQISDTGMNNDVSIL